MVGQSYGTIEHILSSDLNMRHISAKSMPRLLSNEQVVCRISVYTKLKQQVKDEPNFISNITTSHELWINGCDPQNKHQWSQWKTPNSPRPKKGHQVGSHVKSMLIMHPPLDKKWKTEAKTF